MSLFGIQPGSGPLATGRAQKQQALKQAAARLPEDKQQAVRQHPTLGAPEFLQAHPGSLPAPLSRLTNDMTPDQFDSASMLPSLQDSPPSTRAASPLDCPFAISASPTPPIEEVPGQLHTQTTTPTEEAPSSPFAAALGLPSLSSQKASGPNLPPKPILKKTSTLSQLKPRKAGSQQVASSAPGQASKATQERKIWWPEAIQTSHPYASELDEASSDDVQELPFQYLGLAHAHEAVSGWMSHIAKTSNAKLYLEGYVAPHMIDRLRDVVKLYAMSGLEQTGDKALNMLAKEKASGQEGPLSPELTAWFYEMSQKLQAFNPFLQSIERQCAHYTLIPPQSFGELVGGLNIYLNEIGRLPVDQERWNALHEDEQADSQWLQAQQQQEAQPKT